MNYRFVSASLALACLVVMGASVPAQAEDWGRPGYGHHHNGPLPATGVGSADTSTITMVIGGGPYLGRMPLIRCGRTGIRTSKLFHERRLRPAQTMARAEAGSSASVL